MNIELREVEAPISQLLTRTDTLLALKEDLQKAEKESRHAMLLAINQFWKKEKMYDEQFISQDEVDKLKTLVNQAFVQLQDAVGGLVGRFEERRQIAELINQLKDAKQMKEEFAVALENERLKYQAEIAKLTKLAVERDAELVQVQTLQKSQAKELKTVRHQLADLVVKTPTERF